MLSVCRADDHRSSFPDGAVGNEIAVDRPPPTVIPLILLPLPCLTMVKTLPEPDRSDRLYISRTRLYQKVQSTSDQ
ncbi:MAG TPA: hypothetical protein VHW43_06550 [Puia sp.]|nr:hypothetical protein [Puia sp.]